MNNGIVKSCLVFLLCALTVFLLFPDGLFNVTVNVGEQTEPDTEGMYTQEEVAKMLTEASDAAKAAGYQAGADAWGSCHVNGVTSSIRDVSCGSCSTINRVTVRPFVSNWYLLGSMTCSGCGYVFASAYGKPIDNVFTFANGYELYFPDELPATVVLE